MRRPWWQRAWLDIMLLIPAGYGADLARGTPVRVQVIVNGDNANTASAVVGYAGAIVAGGKGTGLLFRHGEIVKKFDEKDLADVLVKEVEELARERSRK